MTHASSSVAPLVVHPLRLGEAKVESGWMAQGWVVEGKVSIPITAYLVLGGPHPILVDAGLRPQGGADTVVEENDLAARLAQHGLGVEDIKTVVFTHLHIDHAGLADRLPNARLVVQRVELQYAAAPLYPESLYDRTDISKLVEPLWPRVELIDGDLELAPGIRCVQTRRSFGGSPDDLRRRPVRPGGHHGRQRLRG